MMARRILQFLAGLILLGAGGYVAWPRLDQAAAIFPPDPGNAPWLLLAGMAGVLAGLVLAVGAWLPDSREMRAAAEAGEHARREAIRAAEARYAERARVVGRDWRSGPLPPGPGVEPTQPPDVYVEPEPATEHSFAAAVAPDVPAPVVPTPAIPASAVPAPALSPHWQAAPDEPSDEPSDATPAEPDEAPPPPPAMAEVEPVATPSPRPHSPLPATFAERIRSFPAAATLAPIPRSLDPPPHPAPPHAMLGFAAVPMAARARIAPRPAVFEAMQPAARSPSLVDIRNAIETGDLDHADRLIADERARMKAAGDDEALALAELTGLAGDHAAASDRLGGAKWLWRLALRRFSDAGAMDSPAARAVSERLRLAD